MAMTSEHRSAVIIVVICLALLGLLLLISPHSAEQQFLYDLDPSSAYPHPQLFVNTENSGFVDATLCLVADLGAPAVVEEWRSDYKLDDERKLAPVPYDLDSDRKGYQRGHYTKKARASFCELSRKVQIPTKEQVQKIVQSYGAVMTQSLWVELEPKIEGMFDAVYQKQGLSTDMKLEILEQIRKELEPGGDIYENLKLNLIRDLEAKNKIRFQEQVGI